MEVLHKRIKVALLPNIVILFNGKRWPLLLRQHSWVPSLLCLVIVCYGIHCLYVCGCVPEIEGETIQSVTSSLISLNNLCCLGNQILYCTTGCLVVHHHLILAVQGEAHVRPHLFAPMETVQHSCYIQ